MENYIPEVAKMLGVELGERFKIYDEETNYPFYYYFSNDGLMVDKENSIIYAGGILRDLLCGKYSITRNPWKPSSGDCYWYVDTRGVIYKTVWLERDCAACFFDINSYKLGNCYRTREEAEANKDKWIKFYASDDVLEV